MKKYTSTVYVHTAYFIAGHFINVLCVGSGRLIILW